MKKLPQAIRLLNSMGDLASTFLLGDFGVKKRKKKNNNQTLEQTNYQSFKFTVGYIHIPEGSTGNQCQSVPK